MGMRELGSRGEDRDGNLEKPKAAEGEGRRKKRKGWHK